VSLLSPIEKEKAYVLAAQQIKARILDGTWQPGDRLPAERDLAAQLAISRGTTREALRIVEAIGLIEINPGAGAIVRERESLLDDYAESRSLPVTVAEVGDIWEARKLIEPGAAYLAAERCDEAELRAIEDSLTPVESQGENGPETDVFHTNSRFHLAVARATGNAMIIHFQMLLTGAERRAATSEPSPDGTPERSAESLLEHRRIFEAIAASRPEEAERAMFDHLLNSWMAKGPLTTLIDS
jgi:GntR family transcriptional repressor for pyruvate dehydrogenase complex